MLGDVLNYLIDGKLSAYDALEAKSQARQALSETDYLKIKVEKLMLITEAIWVILKDKYELTDEDLISKINEIDMRDGRHDGKVAVQPPDKCNVCGRVVQKGANRCIYCGNQIEVEIFKR